MTAAIAELARHIDHRLSTRDGIRLRCHDCQQTISLTALLAATSSTSNPQSHRDPKPDEQCATHLGEWAHACRCCRAEQLEAGQATAQGQVQLKPTGIPPTAAYLTARQQLDADRAAKGEAPDRTYDQWIQETGGRMTPPADQPAEPEDPTPDTTPDPPTTPMENP